MSSLPPPLEGLRVLDFTTLLPGPCATLMLADLGAEVLRIEAPDRPDLLRLMPPWAGQDQGQTISAGQAYLNRGKRSLALDLKATGAVQLIHRLLREYDIVLEQFRPGVMARLGLDYPGLSKAFPGLIYCSITGYGQAGPWSERAGHDINYLALSGVASNSGRKDSGPALTGVQIADVAGGSHQAVIGILAAVIGRQRHGRGTHIDVSMSDAALSLNHLSMAAWLAGEPTPTAETELLNGGSAYDYYRCADGGWIAMGALEPKFSRGVCEVLGCPELATRMVHLDHSARQQCRETLAKHFAQQDRAYWQEAFAAHDLCVEPVLNFDEVRASAHFQAREMWVRARLPDGTLIEQVASPLRFDGSRYAATEAGGALGADQQEVLASLGYSADECRRMASDGLFGRRNKARFDQ